MDGSGARGRSASGGDRFIPTRSDLDDVRTFAGGNALVEHGRRPER